jgi:hypothetical protein
MQDNKDYSELIAEPVLLPSSLSSDKNITDDSIEVDNVIDLVHLIAEAKKKYNK